MILITLAVKAQERWGEGEQGGCGACSDEGGGTSWF